MARTLPDWIDGYLQFTSNTEAPDIFRRWVALSTLAAALQRRCWLDWDIRLYTNMYIALVGPAGRSRKGTALNPAKQLLQEIGVKTAPDAASRQALLEKLIGSSIINGPLDIPTSALTAFCPELTVFFGYDSKEFVQWLCAWYDSPDVWSYSTKARKDEILTNVYLNLIGATTPSLLVKALPPEALGGGLTSRMLLIYSEDAKVIVFPFKTPDEIELYKKLKADLESVQARISGSFTPDKDFLKSYEGFYLDHRSRNIFAIPELQTYLERRQTHILKLSMLMSVSRGEDMRLTEVDFNRAYVTLREAETHMPRVFSGYGKSKYAELYPRIMAVVGSRRTISRAELFTMFHKELDGVADMDTILSALSLSGFCEVREMVSGTKREIMVIYKKEE